MKKEEWVKKQALIIGKRKISERVKKKLVLVSRRYDVPVRLLEAIVLIESFKRPLFFRFAEKLLFIFCKVLCLKVTISLGITQVKVSTSKNFGIFPISESELLERTGRYLKKTIEDVGLDIKMVGYKYNGSMVYGQILETIYLNSRIKA